MTNSSITPTLEQKQRAEWDLILLNIDARTEQIRQMKAFEGRRLAIQAISAAATVFIAGAAIFGVLGYKLGSTPPAPPVIIYLTPQGQLK